MENIEDILLTKTSLSNEIVTSAILIKVFTLRACKEHNFEITPEQFTILDAILKNEKIYQRQLGIILGKDRANVARLINILEKKGLIKKVVSSNGRQINMLEITKKGIEIQQKMNIVIEKLRSSYLNNVTNEELENCIKTLVKIKQNISKNTKISI